MRFTVVTFGCQMNMHDSDRMEEVLLGGGHEQVSKPADADLIVLNTCSVREKAEQKLRSEVGRLGLLKKERPELLIGVAGCVAQQEGERLMKRLPQIDLIVGPDNIPELPELVRQLELGGPPRVRTEFDLDAPSFLQARPALGGRVVAPTTFVTTMKGCNERCTFCIVPYTRGAERYRPSAEVLDEVARLVDAGVSEITLLGQTVNSYRDPSGALGAAPGYGDARWKHTVGSRAKEDETEFAALLRAIAARGGSGLKRLRYTSPHPRHLTVSLIRAHQELPVLADHVHMPVQSGSDRLLKRMSRRYTVAEYEERLAALRDAVPGVTLSTDVIVGFPGETDEDFDATLALVERVGFTGLFGFKYSQRPYTPALKLADDVSEADKSARLARLFEVAEGIRQRHLVTLVGSTQAVLVEGPGRGGGYTGRTARNEIVHLGCADDPTGQIVDVVVEEAFKNSLAGVMADASRRAPRTAPVTATAASPSAAGPAPTPDGRRALPVL